MRTTCSAIPMTSWKTHFKRSCYRSQLAWLAFLLARPCATANDVQAKRDGIGDMNMAVSYTIKLSLFMATILIGWICKIGSDGSLGRFVRAYGDEILVVLHGAIGFALTAGV